MAANRPLILAFTLESGNQVVIVEGVAAAVTGRAGCRRSWPPTTPSTIGMPPPPTTRSPTPRGPAGPAYRVRPRVVFGWDANMRAPTLWSFDDTTSLTPKRPDPRFVLPPLDRISSSEPDGLTLPRARTHHLGRASMATSILRKVENPSRI